MPVPAEITAMGKAAHLCGVFSLEIRNPNQQQEGRSRLIREFHVYLEVAMQAKHDALMRGYCQRIGVQGRREDGTQIHHPQAATADTVLASGGFYALRAEVAAEVVKRQMVSRWSEPQQAGHAVFTPGVRVDAAVQNQVQADGFRYEISYWYEGHDVYVLFHCYPR